MTSTVSSRLRTHQWHVVSAPGDAYIEEQCCGFQACGARRRQPVKLAMSGRPEPDEAAWEFQFPDGRWAISPIAATKGPCNGPQELRS